MRQGCRVPGVMREWKKEGRREDDGCAHGPKQAQAKLRFRQVVVQFARVACLPTSSYLALSASYLLNSKSSSSLFPSFHRIHS